MKKALAPASKQTQGQPVGVVDIVPRPFSFCKGKRHRVKYPPLQQNPPELENLPPAGPRGNHPAARGRGGSESLTPFLCSTLFAFFCARFCTVVRAWKGPFPVAVSIMEQERKAASPASASLWRTPANRCRTRLFSALKSAAFRGSQQPLGAFPL